MVKYKCCGKTFLNDASLEEHNVSHPTSWGGNLFGGKSKRVIKTEPSSPPISPPPSPPPSFHSDLPPILLPQIPPRVVSSQVEMPLSPSSLSTSSSSGSEAPPSPPPLPPLENEAQGVDQNDEVKKRGRGRPRKEGPKKMRLTSNMHSLRENWKNWDSAFLLLLMEGNNLPLSETDKAQWNLALDTLVAVRNNLSIRQLAANGDESITLPPEKEMPIVPGSEHDKMAEGLSEVTLQRDILSANYKSRELSLKVQDKVNEQYKKLVTARNEDVYKANQMLQASQTENQKYLF